MYLPSQSADSKVCCRTIDKSTVYYSQRTCQRKYRSQDVLYNTFMYTLHFINKTAIYNNGDRTVNEEGSVSNIMLQQVALILFIWFVIAVLQLQQSL